MGFDSDGWALSAPSNAPSNAPSDAPSDAASDAASNAWSGAASGETVSEGVPSGGRAAKTGRAKALSTAAPMLGTAQGAESTATTVKASQRGSLERLAALRLAESQRTADEARGAARPAASSGTRLARVSYLPGAAPVSAAVAAALPNTATSQVLVDSAAKSKAANSSGHSAAVTGDATSWSEKFGLADPAAVEAPYVAPRFRRGVRLEDEASVPVDEVDDPASLDPRRAAREKAAAKRATRAANVSIAALTRRGMSRWELGNTLTSRGLAVDEVDAELDRLQAVGLIDDAALADTLVRTQHERKGLGRTALVSELRRRHIDQEHIDVAMQQLDADDELARAIELAVRRAPQLRSLDGETAKRRLNAFLMRKGYGSGIVRAAVEVALANSGSRSVRFD